MQKKYLRKIVIAVVIVFSLASLMGILAIGKSIYNNRKEPERVKGAVLEYLQSDVGFLDKYGDNFDVKIESVSFSGEKGERSALVICAISGNEYSLELRGGDPSWTVETVKSRMTPASNIK